MVSLRRVAREAKDIVHQETDERSRVARLYVMRDVVIAVGVGAIIMVYVAIRSDPHYVGPVVVFPFLVIGIGIVAMISSRRHKSTTPEMDRARSVQLLLATPGTIAVALLIVWLSEGDITDGIWAAASAGIGVAIVAAVVYWKSRRT